MFAFEIYKDFLLATRAIFFILSKQIERPKITSILIKKSRIIDDKMSLIYKNYEKNT